jgi:hypothetical protein
MASPLDLLPNGMLPPFLDNLLSGALNPKGNFGDYSHASRTFNKHQFRLAPKVKFLYHVYFDFSPAMRQILKSWHEKHKLEAGLLVKSVDLPGLSINTEVKKKYNRTKHIQTGITYDPINMTFHDDNLGIMTGMLEAYYRYYYADGWHDEDQVRGYYSKAFTDGAGANSGKPPVQNVNSLYPPSSEKTAAKPGVLSLGDNTYKGADSNKTLHGLNTMPTHPFFNSIQISQLSRHTYTQFKIVNPLITNIKFGDMAYGSSSDTNELSVSFNYESIWIERGSVWAGKGVAGTSPTGFGDLSHYDVTPSPNSIYGGGGVSLGSIINGASNIINDFIGDGEDDRGGKDLFDYGEAPSDSNIFKTIIGGANVLGNLAGLTEGGVREEIGNVITGGAGNLYDNVVSGEGGFGGLLE